MSMKLIGMALIVSCIMSEGYCSDAKLLRIETESCLSKVSAGLVVPKEIIKRRLGFLKEADLSKVDEKYTRGNFKDFYQEMLKGKKTDQKFEQFAQSCRELYDTDKENPRTKVAVLMLLEKVLEKYSKTLDLIARSEAFKEKREQMQGEYTGDCSQEINLFLNADKTIGVKK